jgi:hypothetical protein
MKPCSLLNGVADSLNPAQTCFCETTYGSRSSRQSGQSASPGNRKKLVQISRSAAGPKLQDLKKLMASFSPKTQSTPDSNQSV